MNKIALLHQEVQKHLENFPYFKALSAAGKQKFRNRVVLFLRQKTFFGKDGLVLTTEMQVQVAASAIQLTFGLNDFLLRKYRHIWIYPQSFYYSISNQWMKGYTSKNGRLAFSWVDFKKGYENETDNYNLGLHEMAHALHETILGGSAEPSLEYFFQHWEASTKRQFQDLKRGANEFLRKYGGTNEHEFFAVCVEHFFESPSEFKEKLPELYYHLSTLLYQDPLNTTGDYAINVEEIEEFNKEAKFPVKIGKVMRSYKYRDWHWTLTVTMIGIFIGTIALAYNAHHLILKTENIVMVVIGIGSLSLFQVPYLRRVNAMPAAPIFFMYVIFGVGVNLSALFFILNNATTTDGKVTTHKVTDYVRQKGGYIYELEDGSYTEFPEFRSLTYSDLRLLGHPDSLSIRTEKGIFGIRVHKVTWDPRFSVQTHELLNKL